MVPKVKELECVFFKPLFSVLVPRSLHQKLGHIQIFALKCFIARELEEVLQFVIVQNL